MMAKLLNQTQNCEIIQDLQVADCFWSRLVGLLGKKGLSGQEGMWFDRCNSIHTFGMRFSLDLIFLDRSMKVKALKRNVPPGRMTWPVFGARSVVELASGSLDKMKIEIGDQLHVGH
jgi:uncharacterized protein